jgi:hypothetical protein
MTAQTDRTQPDYLTTHHRSMSISRMGATTPTPHSRASFTVSLLERGLAGMRLTSISQHSHRLTPPDYAKGAAPVELRAGHARQHVVSHNESIDDAVRHGAEWELATVSYWEWAKLIATAFLISCAMTTAAFALWWVVT